AAIALLLIAGVIAIYRMQRTTPPSSSMAALPKPVIKTNTGNQSQLLILPDQSEVWLEPRGTIVYTADFAVDQRMVSLNGDAKFNVKKQAKWPFVVQAKGYNVTALGTEFIVK